MAKKTTVTCTADLSIQHAEEMQKRLQKALEKAPLCVLDGSKVERADSAGLQLIIAFKRFANAHEVTVKWQKPSDALIKAAQLLGVTNQLELP